MKNFSFKTVFFLLGFLTFSTAKSADILVDTTADDDDSSTTSLRDAIAMASDGDVIYLGAGNYCLSKGTLEINNKTLAIVGESETTTFIGGDDIDPANGSMDECDEIENRIFSISFDSNTTGTISLSGMTLTGGNSLTTSESGGALGLGVDNLSNVTLNLDHVVFDLNRAVDGGGAFVSVTNESTAQINCDSVRFSGNYADNSGGAMVLGGESISTINLSLNETEILLNVAQVFGGGIALAGKNSNLNVNFTDSTFDSNQVIGAMGFGGAFGLILDGAWSDVSILNTKLTFNKAPTGAGAWVYATGRAADINAKIEKSIVNYNEASLNTGGLYFKGEINTTIDLDIENTSLLENISEGPVGALVVNADEATSSVNINQSVIADNFANGEGGGLFLYSGTNVITNSTISSNKSSSGGGIYLTGGGALTLSHSTLVYNIAVSSDGSSGVGGGVDVQDGTAQTFSTILAFNTADSDSVGDCSGSITSLGYTLVDSTHCSLVSSGDPTKDISVTTDLFLDAFGYYGGLTQTYPLGDETIAIDHGSCEDGVTVDQRGFTRTEPCDIGAFENDAIPPDGDTTGSDTTGSDTSGSDTTSGSTDSGVGDSGGSGDSTDSGSSDSGDTSGSETTGSESGSTSGTADDSGSSSTTGESTSSTSGTDSGSSDGSTTTGSSGGSTTGGITGANPDVEPEAGNLNFRGGATSDCSLHTENTNQAGTFYFVLLALSFFPLFSGRFSKAVLSSGIIK